MLRRRLPTLFDPSVTSTVDQIHAALNDPADVLAAECGVLALREFVQPHLKLPVDTAADKPLARRLRHLLDDRLEETFTIAEVAADEGPTAVTSSGYSPRPTGSPRTSTSSAVAWTAPADCS